jgi:hypothetical protein
MSTSLQETFTAALFAPECANLYELISSPTPASRFAVYRNNVLSSLIDVLSQSYPVVKQLVGETFFNVMALAFVRLQPPESRLMVEYGEGFATFIESFDPAGGLPYLPDIARLERLRVSAYHAPDINAVSIAAFTGLVAQPECLAGLRCDFHPSLSILISDYAVCSLWHAHQLGGELAKIDPYLPERGLVLRCGLDVELLGLDESTCAFILALHAGMPLGQAACQGGLIDPQFNLGHALALLINKAAITKLYL